VVGGDKLRNHTEFTSPYLGSKEVDDMVRNQFTDPTIYYCSNFSHGYLHVITDTLLNVEEESLLIRFTRVFEMTYKRFLDLQKAEAQAREAKIEAAMERLRSKAMAMQNSVELNDVIQVMYQELKRLNESLNRCFIMIFNEQTKEVTWWMAGDDVAPTNNAYNIPYSDHAPQLAYLKGWEERQEKWQYIMEGNEKKDWDAFLFTETELSRLPEGVIQNMKSFGKIHLSASFSHFGCLTTGSVEPLSEDSFNILLRFAKVFDLSYTRFNDLKQAESQAKEAIKTSSLDRIRGEIASMRTATDLEKITPLIWNELTVLGVPFIRCGVFIMDDSEQLIHTFLSTPGGKAIAAFHLPYSTPGNIREIRSHWQMKELYTDHWNETAFREFAATLVEQGALTTPEQYLETFPSGGFYLHFLPFLQGMLYVGSTQPLREDDLNVTQSIADAFSTAFARYEDFNRLEAAKQQVEKTLRELKAAQQQLIQAEKMASLGELTAGIAHEIQNPLNFVNNFSSLNMELLAEMKQEIATGNYAEVTAIAGDLEKNEEKIVHHGTRADSIVKGMLQHSRVSNGKKEPTNINQLSEEYLRLSYHGFRAKDKSFNATINTQFDESIGEVDVVPQEIGRVLLNLFNNAFYTVHEKKRHLNGSFEPVVSVATKKQGNNIIITVKDNGTGMPQHVTDKVFQPFFTTKPTGQGTGLGLSLSYDIINAHGGELTVESKEGEGATFIIRLPAAYSILSKPLA
jgi:signal transduction histidine kinase